MIIENVKVKVGDVYNLGTAIQHLIVSATNTTGRVTFALSETSKAAGKIMKEYEPKRLKIENKYIRKDKDGNVVWTKPTEEQLAQGVQPIPEIKEDMKAEDMNKEIEELLATEVVLKVRKMNLTDFGMIQFNQQRNPFISLICDIMVTEKETNLVVQ